MSRTLAGHLEDLDLDEVVRVIALSGRSGTLSIESPEGDAELSFLRGQLVSGRLNSSTTTVGERLVTAGILSQDEVSGAGEAPLELLLNRAQARAPGEPTAHARADATLAEQLRDLALDVMEYRTGAFSFRVTEAKGPPSRYPGDTRIAVSRGLDADELAREAKGRRENRDRDPLQRLRDRKKREDAEESPELIVVDNDPQFLSAVDRAAAAAGISVRTLESARAALETLGALDNGTARQLLVAGLVMPRAGGRGILGGLEVLRRARERGFAERVFLAFDEAHPDAAGIARELGAAGVLDKPASENGALPSFAPFLNPILERLGRPQLVDEPIDLVAQLRSEIGDEDWGAEATGGGEVRPTLAALKELLGELNDPSFDEEIPLLVLRFASAFFSRGAIFSVHEDRGLLAGVGGYGIGSTDAGRTVHGIRVPADADSVFSRSMQERLPVQQSYFESEWNNRLLDALGGPRPKEVYTAPIFSRTGLAAVLYADNALDNKPLPDVTLLEIFLQQSGAALERWGMKLRLDALDREQGARS